MVGNRFCVLEGMEWGNFGAKNGIGWTLGWTLGWTVQNEMYRLGGRLGGHF